MKVARDDTRRTILFGLATIPLLPSLSFGQSPPRFMGVMVGQGTRAQGQWRIDAFQSSLRKRGWIDGQNIRVEFKWPEGDPAVAARDAEDLVARRADVLVATNTFATRTLMAATKTVPIVFANVTDPVSSGLVASLARPGGNVTGFTDGDPAIAGKWVQLLRELVPDLRTVVMIHSQKGVGPYLAQYKAAFEDTAVHLGLTRRAENIEAVADYASVLDRCGREGRCAAVMVDDAMFAGNTGEVVRLAQAHKVPAIYTNQGYVITSGGLIAYGVTLVALYDQAIGYVDRILKGEKPGDLPVQMPTTFNLTVSLKAAAAIGIEVPSSILAQADRVVD
jgi:putative ABC transport system substrate-binding protein